MTQFVPPRVEHPLRAMIFAAASSEWYAASEEQREGVVLPRFAKLIAEWQELGARFLASFDDDYLLTGQPGSLQYSIFVIVEVPSLDTLVQMVDRVRAAVDGVRLGTYFRVEARVGRRLFLLER